MWITFNRYSSQDCVRLPYTIDDEVSIQSGDTLLLSQPVILATSKFTIFDCKGGNSFPSAAMSSRVVRNHTIVDLLRVLPARSARNCGFDGGLTIPFGIKLSDDG